MMNFSERAEIKKIWIETIVFETNFFRKEEVLVPLMKKAMDFILTEYENGFSIVDSLSNFKDYDNLRGGGSDTSLSQELSQTLAAYFNALDKSTVDRFKYSSKGKETHKAINYHLENGFKLGESKIAPLLEKYNLESSLPPSVQPTHTIKVSKI